jgi:hypothetical protein
VTAAGQRIDRIVVTWDRLCWIDTSVALGTMLEGDRHLVAVVSE